MKSLVLLVAVICASELVAIPINPDYLRKVVAAYKAKADAGDAKSQYLYANALHKGLGVPKDNQLAFDYAVKAAKGGCKHSLYLVGLGMKDGWKQQPDSKKAENFFKNFIAWAQTVPKDATASHLLGNCYLIGLGVKEDKECAMQFYKRASDLGDQEARVKLALCYVNGIGVKKDAQKGVQMLQECADNGSALAMQKLVDLRMKGTGSIAELGNQNALINLALCYVYGTGVKKDVRKGVQILQECADNGSTCAMRNLADLRMKGTGIIKDVSKAIALYEKAAEMGDDISMCKLGDWYRVNFTSREAFKWYKKAAENGSEIGEIETAVAYLDHRGDVEDHVRSERKGLRLFLKIVNSNSEYSGYAEDKIGLIYENGLAGTKKDKEKALEWYEKSAMHGCDWGLQHLESLENELFDADTVLDRRAERAKASGGKQ